MYEARGLAAQPSKEDEKAKKKKKKAKKDRANLRLCGCLMQSWQSTSMSSRS